MSLSGVQFFMFRLKSDSRLQESAKSGSGAAFAEFDLTADEKTALESGDVASLYAMGVHPLLLAPYSRAMGIPRPRYRELLEPLKGTRTLRS